MGPRLNFRNCNTERRKSKNKVMHQRDNHLEDW